MSQQRKTLLPQATHHHISKALCRPQAQLSATKTRSQQYTNLKFLRKKRRTPVLKGDLLAAGKGNENRTEREEGNKTKREGRQMKLGYVPAPSKRKSCTCPWRVRVVIYGQWICDASRRQWAALCRQLSRHCATTTATTTTQMNDDNTT